MRDVLILVGGGAFLVASVVMPGLPMILKPFLGMKRIMKFGRGLTFHI